MKASSFSVQVSADSRYGYVDVTDELRRAIKDSGVTHGISVAYCTHTTCTLLINEWEDGVLEDLKARLAELVPHNIYYAHDDLGRRTQNLMEDERDNGPAHVIQMLVGGTSHTIPVDSGEPILGRWQRLFLLELDQPRERNIVFYVVGE